MRRLAPALLALALFWPAPGGSFTLLSFDWVWADSSTRFSSGRLSSPFAEALVAAATQWTDATKFSFEIDGLPRGSCEGGSITNGAEFAAVTCRSGRSFDPNILAVTEFEIRGGEMFAGVTFNSDEVWSVYDGPWRTAADFRRTALHELGHVLGLSHESRVASIMAPTIGSLFTLQADDVAGAAALYGQPLPAEVRCERAQLRESGKLCERSLRCEARARARADEPESALARDRCMARAEDQFERGWERAISVAQNALGHCHQTRDASSAALPIQNTSVSIAEQVGSPAPDDRDDRRLRSQLLRGTAQLCERDFTAHRRDVLSDNPVSLARRLERARARFSKRSARIIQGFARRGAPYDGGDPSQIADDTNALANAIALDVAPPP